MIWSVSILRLYLEDVHFILRTDHDALKWLFGTESNSRKRARWRLHLQKFSFTAEYTDDKKNTAEDAMLRLNTTGGDNTEKPIDVEVPVLSIEEDVNQPTLHDHEVAISKIDKDDHPRPFKSIALEDMLAAHRKDF